MRYLAALITTALLSGGGSALATEPPASSEYTPPNAGHQQQVSEEKLKQFSDAMDEVQTVQQEYSQEIREAENMEQAQALQNDAQEDMRSAVQDTGLSISEYNQISQQLQGDPDLLRRLQDIRSE